MADFTKSALFCLDRDLTASHAVTVAAGPAPAAAGAGKGVRGAGPAAAAAAAGGGGSQVSARPVVKPMEGTENAYVSALDDEVVICRESQVSATDWHRDTMPAARHCHPASQGGASPPPLSGGSCRARDSSHAGSRALTQGARSGRPISSTPHGMSSPASPRPASGFPSPRVPRPRPPHTPRGGGRGGRGRARGGVAQAQRQAGLIYNNAEL